MIQGYGQQIKCNFFDLKIQEITNKNCGLWELMDWVKKQKLLAIEAIQYNSQLCIKLKVVADPSPVIQCSSTLSSQLRFTKRNSK